MATQPLSAPNCDAPQADGGYCTNLAEYLVEYGGWTCADDLSLTVDVALGTVADLDPTPDVRIRSYEPEAPDFSA